MNWIDWLQNRWKLNSTWQVVVVLTVFACTGLTIHFLKYPILAWLFGDFVPVWARILYWIVILPIYNVVLLFYGFVFGHFRFFWEFEKRFFSPNVFTLYQKMTFNNQFLTFLQ